MNKEKNDRYQETETKIKNALLIFLETKKAEKITVQQICSQAGIHRSSFYLHFMDIYDVMEKIENEFSRKLLEIFVEDITSGGIGRMLLLHIFHFVKENESFYRAFLAGNTEVSVFKLAQQSELKKMIPVIQEKAGMKLYDGLDYHMVFLAKGMEGVIRKWVEAGCKTSPELMAEMICKEYELRKL